MEGCNVLSDNERDGGRYYCYCGFRSCANDEILFASYKITSMECVSLTANELFGSRKDAFIIGHPLVCLLMVCLGFSSIVAAMVIKTPKWKGICLH